VGALCRVPRLEVSAESGQLARARTRPFSRVVGRPLLRCLLLLRRKGLVEGRVTQEHLPLGAYPLTSDLQQAWNRRRANHPGVRPRPSLSVPASEHANGDLASWVPHCFRTEIHGLEAHAVLVLVNDEEAMLGEQKGKLVSHRICERLPRHAPIKSVLA
jgi:hypothetical protein